MVTNQNKDTDDFYRVPSQVRQIYRFIFPSLPSYIKKELAGCRTVLDLGCGDGSYSALKDLSFKKSLGVEKHTPAWKECLNKKIHTDCINADMREVSFKDRSFDAVLMLNVIEHMSKEEGRWMISRCLRWASKKVVICTPNGFLPQEEFDDNPFQQHLSGWNASELRRMGFAVHGYDGWQFLRGPRARLKFQPLFFWQPISDLTQTLVYHFPERAFRLLATMKIDGTSRDF